MPPKKGAGGGGGGDREKADLAAEDVLQAVLLTDSFNRRFRPITLEKPRCLLPLCSKPLIEYTIEFLSMAGVRELFVFCCSHAKEIEAYLTSSKWVKPGSPLKVVIIVSKDSLGPGDALRDIDAKRLIRSDFILVGGDVISNMDLKTVLQEHRERRKKDKSNIMTIVLKKAAPNHHIRSFAEESVVTLDPETNEILQYNVIDPYGDQKVVLPVEVLGKSSRLQIRYDLTDCYIDICAPEVLPLCSDNFDYQDVRRDVVKGVLEADLLRQHIFAHIIDYQYASRVQSLRSYDVISKDVIGRWAFPMVPDSNFLEGSHFTYQRRHIYKETDVVLARSCVLDRNVVVGRRSTIGDNTKIVDSVIGHNCKIGDNVTIEGAYLWDNVTVGNNVRIRRSILCDDVQIKDDVVIPKGCIISFRVVVGPNVILPENTRLTMSTVCVRKMEDDEFAEVLEEDAMADAIKANFGDQSTGYIWDSERNWTDPNITWEDRLQAPIGFDITPPRLDDFDDSELDELNDLGEKDDDEPAGFEDGNEESLPGDEEEEVDVKPEANALAAKKKQRDEYVVEAKETITRSMRNRYPIENLALELGSLKLVYNVNISAVAEASLLSMLDEIKPTDVKGSLPEVCARYSPLLKKYISSPASQLETIFQIQNRILAALPHLVPFFSLLLQHLYNQDVLDDANVIISWYGDSSWDNAPENARTLRSKTNKFIEFLQTEDDDDDEEEEEDDEDE